MSRINRAIYSPKLWFGVEKKWILFLFFCTILVIALGDMLEKIIAASSFIAIWALLAYLYSTDHLFFSVLFRHLLRKGKYKAFSSCDSKHYHKVKYKPK